MFRRLIVLLVLLGLVLALSIHSPNQPVNAQDDGANLLQNPGFEGDFIAVGGDNTLRVAEGWQNWNLPPPAGADNSTNLRPDYQPAPPTRVNEGSGAQQYDTFFATHVGGIYQEVVLSTTGTVTFSAFVYPYSSLSFEDINSSEDPQGLEVSVGIDPNGGTNGGAPEIIWSDPVEYYDAYEELTVTTQATSTEITVFVRSSVERAPGLHQVFVDDAALTFSAGGTPTAEPSESETAEVTETVTPVATEAVTETSTATTPAPSETMTEVATEAPSPDLTEEAPENPTAIPREPYSDALPNEISYTVQSGDTVGAIAERFSSEAQAIIDYNSLEDNGLIYIDQNLLIPVPAGVGRPVAPPAEVPPGGGQGSDPDAGGTGGSSPTAEDVYVVQAGDNLFRIALRFNLGYETLARYNGIVNPNLVYVGQTIRIPASATIPDGTPATAQPIVTVAPPTTQGTYYGNTVIHIVQPGENIFRIGLRYNVTWDVIARANGLYNPNLVFVGQQLIIPTY